MAQILPLPPNSVAMFDPNTGSINALWQNFFLSLGNLGQFAPLDAQYWLSTSNAILTNERNIGALATGYLKIVTTIGVAVPSTTTTIPSTDITGLPVFASSTYTPTLTSVANVAASTAYACQYLRVGATVTVSGKLDLDPTGATTLTQLGISLPIASSLAAAEQCGGTAVAPAVAGYCAAILADATNDRAELNFTTAADVANRSWWFSFTYTVL